ncbi:helix-hairpin-helix domain-containing protein [Yersinia sp. Marseille-Q3913]|uniref:helix-hairpin-helix domain-containing protein n=1 Tax=Yersinia sp. Marseille-Q3913 TaxID=2830769 RepID=UPI001BAFECB6|nr:helix-hairpin-helix domain-containing protein [Yersinia sp. Marseille-Q3913]MBS0056497.1 helix-hairpin-helix domain-containing protein [Yersinia sp. Marseille-Q3913]
MAFTANERNLLLAVKGVGPTVVTRLEQLGFTSLGQLSQATMSEIVSSAAAMMGSTCWKNSPQARSAIQAAIDMAKTHSSS